MNVENPTTCWDQANLWKRVEILFPGVIVANPHLPLSPVNLEALVILCPLYEPGTLAKAGLIHPPLGIGDSRVAKKVEGYTAVLRAINSVVKTSDGQLHLKVIFANKGVLLGKNPTEEDKQLLSYHQIQYQSYFSSLCAKEKMNYSFNDYDTLGVDFPQFVNPETELPDLQEKSGTEAYQMLEKLNSFLNLPDPVVNSNKSRKKTKDIIDAVSFVPAFWLIAGYLAFDYKIKQILGSNGVYLCAERMVSLLGTAYLTPGLSKITRIQIPA